MNGGQENGPLVGFGEDDPIEKVSKTPPSDFVDHFLELKELKDHSISEYCRFINKLRDMAKGGNAGGMRETDYPKWSNDDFRQLLFDLGEK